MERLEAIVVLTGPTKEIEMQRAETGVREFYKDERSLILISGSTDGRYFPGSQPGGIYKRMRKQGVPRESFIFEAKSKNTIGNVKGICEIVKEKEISKLKISTDKSHGNRFKMIFNKAKNLGYVPRDLEIEISSEGISRSYSRFGSYIHYAKSLWKTKRGF